MEGHVLPNLSCRINDNLISDVERVLKQFEFLEDEVDCKTKLAQRRKNADVEVGSSVKYEVMNPDSSSSQDNNLEALQKLQNSVEEVNQLFSDSSRTESVNSGIFYAELVMTR